MLGKAPGQHSPVPDPGGPEGKPASPRGTGEPQLENTAPSGGGRHCTRVWLPGSARPPGGWERPPHTASRDPCPRSLRVQGRAHVSPIQNSKRKAYVDTIISEIKRRPGKHPFPPSECARGRGWVPQGARGPGCPGPWPGRLRPHGAGHPQSGGHQGPVLPPLARTQGPHVPPASTSPAARP